MTLRKYKHLFILLFIILTLPFIRKYVYIQHNQYEQIPLILRANKPTFLANDWSVNINSQFSPRYFYTAYMASVARFFTLPATYFIHYLIAVGTVAYATFFLSRLLFRDNFAAILTTMAILYGQHYTLGGNDLVGGDLDPHRLALGIVLCAITLVLSRKFFLSAIFFAISTYIHPLLGYQSALILYTSVILSYKFARSTPAAFSKTIKPVLLAAILFMFLSLGSFFSYASQILQQRQFAIPSQTLFIILMRVRAPLHYLVTLWPSRSFIYFGALVAVSAFIFHKKLVRVTPFIKRLINWVCAQIVVLCLIQTLFTVLIPSYEIAVGQFFRLTVIMYWLSAVVLFSWCFTSFRNRNFGIFSYIFPILPFIITNLPKVMRFSLSSILYIFLSIVVGLLVYYDRARKITYIILIVSLASYGLLFRHYPFVYNKTYPFPTSETDIAQWVSFHTSDTSVFLTPPNFYTFRLTAQRAIIVDWLVMPFEKRGMVEWMQRIIDISGLPKESFATVSEQKVLDGYNKMNLDTVVKLQEKYAFDYIIVENHKDLPFKRIYRNSQYSLYKV